MTSLFLNTVTATLCSCLKTLQCRSFINIDSYDFQLIDINAFVMFGVSNSRL